MKRSIYYTRTPRKLSLNQLRNWRAGIRYAREIMNGGGLDTALILRYWRGSIYRDSGLPCVYRLRAAREAARRAVFAAYLDTLPMEDTDANA